MECCLCNKPTAEPGARLGDRARAPRPHESPPARASCMHHREPRRGGCHGDGGAVDLTQGARPGQCPCTMHACVDDDDFPTSRGSISGPPLTCSALNSCLEQSYIHICMLYYWLLIPFLYFVALLNIILLPAGNAKPLLVGLSSLISSYWTGMYMTLISFALEFRTISHQINAESSLCMSISRVAQNGAW